MTNQPDEFDGIFDSLTAADFERETSAVLQSYTAPPSFDEFIQRHLAATRIAFAASDGRLNPIAWLTQVGNIEVAERIFVPDDDETLRMFINRLAREAEAHNATTVFFVMKTQASVAYSPDGTFAPGQEIAGTPNPETATDALLWFAQHLEERKSGVITIVDDTKLGAEVVTGGDQHLAAFEQILAGVSK